MQSKFLSFVFVILFSSSSAFALTDIGDTLKCSGTDIINSKNNKVVKYSKYKSTTQQTLERLKDKLAGAPKTKKQGIKDQITAKKNELKSVTLCSKGKLDVGTVDPLFSQLAANGGTFTGPYNGSVISFLGTINVQGNLSFNFSLTGTVFKFTIKILSGSASTLISDDLVFEADVGGQALPFEVQIPDTFLGTVNMEIKADGTVNIISQEGPVFNGTFTANQSSGTLSATSYKSTSFNIGYTATR
jgi:hypothetical protein